MKKHLYPIDIALDESILAALRAEIAACPEEYAAGVEPEAAFLAWTFLHFAELAAEHEHEMEDHLAIILAEAATRVREEALEIIRPHCEAKQ